MQNSSPYILFLLKSKVTFFYHTLCILLTQEHTSTNLFFPFFPLPIHHCQICTAVSCQSSSDNKWNLLPPLAWHVPDKACYKVLWFRKSSSAISPLNATEVLNIYLLSQTYKELHFLVAHHICQVSGQALVNSPPLKQCIPRFELSKVLCYPFYIWYKPNCKKNLNLSRTALLSCLFVPFFNVLTRHMQYSTTCTMSCSAVFRHREVCRYSDSLCTL